jgi:tetratricopeptide (TPR) repeat protein
LGAIFYILDVFPGTALYEDFQRKTKTGDDVWLKRIEDIMYFETDLRLSRDMILAFGQKLRAYYYHHLPEFADAIQLIDEKDLYESHADFLSRLAMTFSHGEYAAIKDIPEKEEVALRLYKKSLSYYPNQRAYLGLGIIRQKQRNYEDSLRILSEGVSQYPDDESLVTCLGISYMNLNRFKEAREVFQKLSDSPNVLPYISACYRALGDSEKGVSGIK